MTDDDFACECCPYFIDGYCHNCTHEDCVKDMRMTKSDPMLELEEKVNKAAKECSDRLWNKKWNPGQDMLSTAFIEGVKWLARESMKEQKNG